jgi:hypothetical protein
MAHFWSLCEGIASGALVGRAGRRKGKAPVGDAWLLDGVISKSTPTNFRYAYCRIRDQYTVETLGARIATYLPFETLRVKRRATMARIGRFTEDKQLVILSAERSTLRYFVCRVSSQRKLVKKGFYGRRNSKE